MLGKRLLLAGVLFLAMTDVSRAQVAGADTGRRAPVNRNGSWSAATSIGQTLMGTWTAVLDTAGTVTGTWELLDPQGNTVALGGWSAAKTDGWTGVWRATIAGRDGEFAGTWTAALGGKAAAPLADLFQNGLKAIVSGSWRLGQRSGAWSIRTFK